jgi:agmatinase
LPATGTPEPGGLDWYRVVGLLREIAARHEIVGFDVVELAPVPGFHASEFLAAKLAYRFMGYIARSRRMPPVF